MSEIPIDIGRSRASCSKPTLSTIRAPSSCSIIARNMARAIRNPWGTKKQFALYIETTSSSPWAREFEEYQGIAENLPEANLHQQKKWNLAHRHRRNTIAHVCHYSIRNRKSARLTQLSNSNFVKDSLNSNAATCAAFSYFPAQHVSTVPASSSQWFAPGRPGSLVIKS